MNVVGKALRQVLFGEGIATQTIGLRPARDPWPYLVALNKISHDRLIRARSGFHAWRMRARSDHRHVAEQDVNKLWELVEAGAPQKITNSRHTAIAALGQANFLAIALGIKGHAAELVDAEQLVAQAIALLFEQHRSRRLQFNCQGNQQAERHKHQQGTSRKSYVEKP